jgi:hypothetical protein
MNGGVWVASYVLLWVTVVALGVVVVALLRQVGVLHARMRPLGVHFGGEGLAPGTPAPAVDGHDYGSTALTLVAFTAPDCEICAQLTPSLDALRRDYSDIATYIVDHSPTTLETFRAFAVHSTPYVVAVDKSGVVRGRGVANSLEQVEVLVEDALAEANTDDVR